MTHREESLPTRLYSGTDTDTDTDPGTDTDTDPGTDTDTDPGTDTDADPGTDTDTDTDPGTDTGTDPGTQLGITILHPERSPGQSQSATGTGFEPGEVVTGVMQSDPLALGTRIANAAGQVTFTWVVPSNLEVGIHTVTLTGAESGSVSIQFRVIPSGLATTGADSGPFLTWSLMLLLVGSALAVGARKRRISVTSTT